MFQLNPFRLSLFMPSASVAIWLGYFFLEATEAIQLIKMGGYWLMLLSVVLLALSHFHPQGWVRTLTTEVRTHELASDSLD